MSFLFIVKSDTQDTGLVDSGTENKATASSNKIGESDVTRLFQVC